MRALCERKEEEIDQLKALAKAVDEGRERVVTALRERIADVSKKDAVGEMSDYVVRFLTSQKGIGATERMPSRRGPANCCCTS